jgi:3,2-trans-enoyl-CoA isomerase
MTMISKISSKSLTIGSNTISRQVNSSRILPSQLKRRTSYPTTTTYHRQSFSTSPPSPSLVTTSIISSSDFSDDEDEDEDDGGSRIAIIRMNNKPVNALSMEMCTELSNAIKTVNEQQSTSDDAAATSFSSIVISSSIPTIFSAGIDIKKELYQPNPKRLSEFWCSFQQLFLDIYGLPGTTISAVNGHAPAGGCMLSLACDYRIMRNNPKSRIGYNESKLGITAPSYVYLFSSPPKRSNDIWRMLSTLSSSFPHYFICYIFFFFSHFFVSHFHCLTFYRWMSQQYIDAIGSHHKAELALLLGTLFTPQDALQIGLIDQLVDDDEVANAANDGHDMNMNIVEMVAIQKAIEFNKIPLIARNNIKKLTRQPLLDQLNNSRQEDSDTFCNFVTSSKVQNFIEKYLNSLAQKSKKSK